MKSEWKRAFPLLGKLISFAPPSGGQLGGPRPDPPYHGTGQRGNYWQASMHPDHNILPLYQSSLSRTEEYHARPK
jgi:hypothetical protein